MKTQRFSLIELLVTLALASFITILFFENLSLFSLKSFKILQAMQAQDHAISALLLLKHQVQSARVTTCAKSLPNYDAYSIVNPESLMVHHLSDTVSLQNVMMPNAFKKNPEQEIVIDDCEQAKAVPESELARVLPEFHYHLTISILETRTYHLGETDDQSTPTALFVYDEKRHDELIPDIAKLTFTIKEDNLVIFIQSYINHDSYQLTF